MQRTFLLPTVLAVLAAGPLQADESLKAARERLLKGNYAEAQEQYAALLKKPVADKTAAAAAIGLSRALASEGRYDEALTALEDAGKQRPNLKKNADLLAEKADLFYLRGRWEEADRAARAAIESEPEQFLAHWVLARLHRDRGETDRAGKELLWFIRTYKKFADDDKEITDPEKLLLIGLAAVERARYNAALSDQFQEVLDNFWADAIKQDKLFWPVEYASGQLYLEKYDKARGTKHFHSALKINPRAAEVLAGKGMIALQRFDMKEAEQYARQALQINPRLIDALQLQADIYLIAGDTVRARIELKKALAVNPRSEALLARQAACLFLECKEAELAKLCAEVEKANPKCWQFYHDLGERLDERKRYEAAERYYRQAMKLRPQRVGIGNQLGLLYMRLGREEEARKILEVAFKSDPFNVRVYNTLKVIDHLDNYASLETKHFQIRYDPKNDRVLARFLAHYLENLYTELAEQFDFQPKGPILVEVFSRHQMFSGRVIALPDLHTIGACTGKMIAMVSTTDRDRVIPKPFNWNCVIRHELVHIFNLEQTRFLCPHWFTEGLAVRAEKMPMPPVWNMLLLERVPTGKLYNLDNIHLGFIRPDSSDEWHLAYLQSLLYVEYLIGKHGPKAIGGMLNAYRDGKDTAQALRQVCQVSKEDFEKGYREYLNGKIKEIAGRPPVQLLTFKELKERNGKEPDNPDISAGLAEQYFLLGDRQKARTLAEAALRKVPAHPLGSYVKARLLLAAGDNDAARDLLTKAIDAKAPEPKVLRLLAKVYFDTKQFAEAAKISELGRQAEPYDNQWLVLLVRCYRQSGDTDKLIDSLRKLVPTNADDLESRRELAQLLSRAGKHAEAERYAREALEINVLDEDARQVLESALQTQNKQAELEQLRKMYQ